MMWNVQSILLACLLGYVSSQNADCDFFQTLVPGQTYYVYSQRYPNYDPPSRTCRWQASAPTGYRARLVCSVIDIMQTTGCVQDRLLISRTGDPSLNGADTFCGVGSTTIESTGQRISVGFITTAVSTGSRFSCTLVAVQGTTPQPTCQCGYKYGSRIVGGVETGRNEYTMMAGLLDLSTNSITCGGVIISTRYVLTAAHCLYQRNLANTAVVVGEHNVRIDDTSPFIQVLRVLTFNLHPLFTTYGDFYKAGRQLERVATGDCRSSALSYDYDIGIVRTQADIVFSEGVGPVCLPFGRTANSFAGSVVTALGWGSTSTGGPTSDVLRKVDLNVIDQTTCRLSWGAITQRQICTYTRGKDTCQDDSGGPLLWPEPTTGRLYSVGIVSLGNLCATTTPGLNTRTTEFLNWIQTQTPDAVYCRP